MCLWMFTYLHQTMIKKWRKLCQIGGFFAMLCMYATCMSVAFVGATVCQRGWALQVPPLLLQCITMQTGFYVWLFLVHHFSFAAFYFERNKNVELDCTIVLLFCFFVVLLYWWSLWMLLFLPFKNIFLFLVLKEWVMIVVLFYSRIFSSLCLIALFLDRCEREKKLPTTTPWSRGAVPPSMKIWCCFFLCILCIRSAESLFCI